ncbi:MAG: hypothetical protein H0U86_10785 [Chloroflexi bacterium]|nr:hypothetical protein [Chloroflexota bacterium]
MSIVTTPGVLDVIDLDPAKLASFKKHGYEWVMLQAQNDTARRGYDMSRVRAAGLKPCVWGVSYVAANFYRDGWWLAERALQLGADELCMDIEMAAKFTRGGGLRPLVKGVRDAGWTGPVHLNTMGPPYNVDVNDYEIDVETILETGGGIFTQAYYNETNAFHPTLAVRYWTRVGVPLDRLNVSISLYPSESDKEKPRNKLSGADYLPLLQDAGVKRNLSIFMGQVLTEDDMRALDPLALPPPPPTTTAVSRARRASRSWTRRGSGRTSRAAGRSR